MSFFPYFQFTVLRRTCISFPLASVLASHVFLGLIISIFTWCSLGQRRACRRIYCKEKARHTLLVSTVFEYQSRKEGSRFHALTNYSVGTKSGKPNVM